MADTFEEAMSMHAAMLAVPLPWNQWHSIAYMVSKAHPVVAAKVGEEPRWLADVRIAVMTSRFGPNWKPPAVTRTLQGDGAASAPEVSVGLGQARPSEAASGAIVIHSVVERLCYT